MRFRQPPRCLRNCRPESRRVGVILSGGNVDFEQLAESMKYLALLFWLAAPFWETAAPADWSDSQLKGLLTDSPWAQLVGATGSSSARAIQVLVATAGPIEQGELEWDRRFTKKKAEPDLMKEEYRVWLQDNRATHIVLAISAGKNDQLSG